MFPNTVWKCSQGAESLGIVHNLLKMVPRTSGCTDSLVFQAFLWIWTKSSLKVVQTFCVYVHLEMCSSSHTSSEVLEPGPKSPGGSIWKSFEFSKRSLNLVQKLSWINPNITWAEFSALCTSSKILRTRCMSSPERNFSKTSAPQLSEISWLVSKFVLQVMSPEPKLSYRDWKFQSSNHRKTCFKTQG